MFPTVARRNGDEKGVGVVEGDEGKQAKVGKEESLQEKLRSSH